MSEPRTFYTADPHHHHRRICELAGRPYQSWEEMDEDLITRWNAVVAPEDWVYCLGDEAFQLGTDGALDYVTKLNGVLILVPGNHDRCHPLHGAVKALQWRERYLAAGYHDVTPPTMRKNIAGRWVTLCHFPYDGDSHDGDRFTEWRPVDDGSWVIHGHVHGKWRQRGRQINVGVDAWNGTPVAEEEIELLIAAGPRDLLPLAWVR